MKCRSCDAEIDFIESAKRGRPIPVDAKPMKVVTRDGEIVDGFVPHWATCPHADQHRKAQ